MRRIVGVIIAVLGVLMVAGGFVVPGGRSLVGSGAFAILIGGIVVGLSFIKTREPDADAPPPFSPFERIMGMFYEPTRVFQNLLHHPRWFAGFIVIVLFVSTYHLAFEQRLTPEKIAVVTADKVIEGGWIPADKQAEFRQRAIDDAKSPIARVVGSLSRAGGTFLLMVALAGLYLLLVLIMGGRLGFLQGVSVAVYAYLPVIVIQNVLNLVLLYIKSPDDIDPIRGSQRGLVQADLSMLFSAADHPYLYTLGGMIGIFTIYGLWLLTTGLRNTGEKVSAGSAWSIALILWFIGVLLVLGLAAIFPNFVT